MNIKIHHIKELSRAAKALHQFADGERFFIFEGNMGAGKTTFIKAFCKELGVTDVVTSPTFSIVNEYDADGLTVYHFDFYRLKNLHEAYDIGYEEYFFSDAVCLIEWPEKVRPLLPETYVKVTIGVRGETEREFLFEKYEANVPVL